MVTFSDRIFPMHFDLKKFVCLYALLLHMQLTRLVVERGLQNNKKKKLMKTMVTFGISNATDPLIQNVTR